MLGAPAPAVAPERSAPMKWRFLLGRHRRNVSRVVVRDWIEMPLSRIQDNLARGSRITR